MSDFKDSGFSAKMLAEAGICIALAKVLSFFTIFHLQNGGSVTAASMAPLFLFAIRWGWKKGILIGMVYGLVDLMIGGYVVNPIQVLLDYPLAYGMLGFAGLATRKDKPISFRESLIPVVAATLLRLLMHTISGIVFYSSEIYAKGGSFKDALVFSASYNASFLLVDAAICLVLLAIIWKPLGMLFRDQRMSESY